MPEQKQRILILGAGVMQGPAIRCAKAMGLETVVIDGDPGAPEASGADRFEPIDLKNIQKIEEFARTLKSEGGLHGVMTAGTDFSASVAWVAEKLKLPGIPYETALDASDKGRMRKRFSEAGLPSPAFTVFTKENCTVTKPGGNSGGRLPADVPFPYPVVVKPVDNMGARGCRMAVNGAELREAVETALGFSRTGQAIVEEYMEGPEFSVDAVVYHGKITICGLADRHIFFPPYFIEMGHTMPAAVPSKEAEAIINVFIRGIQALGIDNGAAKGDIKLTSKGPMIGEIAARLSGGYMSGWTYPYASGANPAKGAICAALGREPEGLNPVRNWTSAERAFISIPGLVRSVEGIDEARNMPGIKELFLRSSPGSRVYFPENNVSKAGNVISAARDRQAAVLAAEKAARTVFIRLKAPDTETGAFLAGPIEAGNSPLFPPPAYVLDTAKLGQLAAMACAAAPGAIMPGALSVAPFPAFTKSDARDYMGRSPAETLETVKKITGMELKETSGKPLLGREFWTALIRGGCQGAVYYLDCLFSVNNPQNTADLCNRGVP